MRSKSLQSDFSVFFQNIRCITNKVSNIEIISSNEKFDILLLSEHWQLNQNLETIPISGYQLGSHFSRNNKIHGGVCIYIKNDIKYEELDLSSFCVELDIEITAIKLVESETIFCSVYRSPLGDIQIFLSKLEEILELLEPDKNKIVLGGDFNLNFASQDKNVNLCHDLFATFDLVAQVTDITRAQGAGGSVIDNIFTNIPDVKHVVKDFKLSDHMAIIAKINILNPVIKNIVKKRDVNKTTINTAKLELSEIDWENIFENNEGQNKFNAIHDKILQVFNKYFPIKNVTQKNSKTDIPWYNQDCIKEKNLLDLMFDMRKDFPNNENFKEN